MIKLECGTSGLCRRLDPDLGLRSSPVGVSLVECWDDWFIIIFYVKVRSTTPAMPRAVSALSGGGNADGVVCGVRCLVSCP